MSNSWKFAVRLASRVEPAPKWRGLLAEALASASQATFVAVYTCPPGEILEGVHSVHPEDMTDVMERIFREVIPKIAWTRHGVKNPSASSGRAYFPFDYENGASLRSLIKPLVEPHEVEEMVHVSFLAEGAIVGGAVLYLPRREGAATILEPLNEVARAAGEALEAAIGLARGCGVQVELEPILPLELLSARELQIARLAATGMTDVNISERLAISEQTVGAHLRRIFLKLRINSRLQLVQEPRLRRAQAM